MSSPTDLKSAVREGPSCGAERTVVSRGSHMALSDAVEGQAARQAWEELNSGEEFISTKGWPRRQGTGNAWKIGSKRNWTSGNLLRALWKRGWSKMAEE